MHLNPITVLIVDDHEIIRGALRALLAAEPDIAVVGEAANGHQAVAFASKLAPHVIIMDVAMPLLNGLDAIQRIRSCTPASTKVLVLSSHNEIAYIKHAEAIGAAGYLVKQSDTHLLPAAIRAVHSGQPFYCPAQLTPIESP